MGRPNTCNPCCAEGSVASSSLISSSSGFSQVSACNVCTGNIAAAQYTVTLSGIGGLAGCTDYNGTHLLTFCGCTGTVAVWSKFLGTGKGRGGSDSLSFQIAASLITFGPVPGYCSGPAAVFGALYSFTPSPTTLPHSCISSYTLNLVSSSGCTGWPASVTVSPA